jgi:hypothetical protein
MAGFTLPRGATIQPGGPMRRGPVGRPISSRIGGPMVDIPGSLNRGPINATLPGLLGQLGGGVTATRIPRPPTQIPGGLRQGPIGGGTPIRRPGAATRGLAARLAGMQ